MMNTVVPRAFTASVLQPEPARMCSQHQCEATILPGTGVGSLKRQSSIGRPGLAALCGYRQNRQQESWEQEGKTGELGQQKCV